MSRGRASAPVPGIQIDPDGRIYAIGNDARGILASNQGELNPLELGRQYGPLLPAHTHQLKSRILFAGRVAAFDNPLEIISFVSHSRRTGSLAFFCEKHRRTLFFDAGQLIGANSTERRDRLGQILVRAGRIGHQRLLAEAKRAQKQTLSLGHHLIQRGVIDKGALQNALEQQIRDVTFSVVMMSDGDFMLTQDPAIDPSRTVKMDTQRILMDSLRRVDELNWVRDRLKESATVRLRWTDEQQSGRSPVEAALRNDLREPKRIGELLDRLAFDDRSIYEGLYSAIQDGLVLLVEPTLAPAAIAPILNDTRTPPSIPRAFNEILMSLHEACAQRDEPAALSRTLNSFLQFYGYTSLFRGVRLDERGALDTASLQINLDELSDVDDPETYIRRALGDFVRFAIVALRGNFSDQRRRAFEMDVSRLTHGQ